VPIPEAELFKARVWGRSLAGIASSNTADSMAVWLLWACVLSVRGLCFWPITRPEECYRLWSVVCSPETSEMRQSWPALGCCPKEVEEEEEMLLVVSFSLLIISAFLTCKKFVKVSRMKLLLWLCATASRVWTCAVSVDVDQYKYFPWRQECLLSSFHYLELYDGYGGRQGGIRSICR
jgi:hypothetical protein